MLQQDYDLFIPRQYGKFGRIFVWLMSHCNEQMSHILWRRTSQEKGNDRQANNKLNIFFGFAFEILLEANLLKFWRVLKQWKVMWHIWNSFHDQTDHTWSAILELLISKSELVTLFVMDKFLSSYEFAWEDHLTFGFRRLNFVQDIGVTQT
jgi:hypothetical protein